MMKCHWGNDRRLWLYYQISKSKRKFMESKSLVVDESMFNLYSHNICHFLYGRKPLWDSVVDVLYNSATNALPPCLVE